MEIEIQEEKNKKIKAELGLYKIREVEIEDMNLKIEELELGEQLSSPSFDEKVQTSISCKDNSTIMSEIEGLKKKIRIYEIANKRIDNALKVLNDFEKDIITKIFIEHKSISRTSAELFKNRKSIKKVINKAIPKIRLY